MLINLLCSNKVFIQTLISISAQGLGLLIGTLFTDTKTAVAVGPVALYKPFKF